MSLSALVWAVFFFGALLLSFVNPLFGALGYLQEYYIRPHLQWWRNDMPFLRMNLLVSVCFGVTFLLRRGSLRQMAPVRNTVAAWLLGLFGVMIFVTLATALNTDLSVRWVTQWAKMALIFPLLLAGVVRTPLAFNAITAAHIAGAGWWGWKAYQNPRRSAGRLVQLGSDDSMDDNLAAAHLLTVIPFIIVYLFTARDKRLRLLALVAAPFVINAIILCNSRGATVAILATTVSSLFLVRSGFRLRIAGAAVASLCAGLLLADPQFLQRQAISSNYGEDGSAQDRLTSWKAGLEIVKDYPLGTGSRGFHLLSPQYIPAIVEQNGGEQRAPHNTWVLVASEWGIAGLICFIGAFASAFRMMEQIKRSTPPEEGFYYWRAFAIQTTLIAYLVAGVFADRLYGEAGYWMLALAFALYRMKRTEEAEQLPVAEGKAQPAAPALSWALPVPDVRAR